jgi:hypothetical protein
MKRYSIEKITTAAILVSGGLVSLIQFLFNRSLWEDEAALALNIIHKSSLELLKPLDYYMQVAPTLFLQIEKLFSMILPNTEYGLRLFPLLCFWASIYLFYRIVKWLDSAYAIVTALSFFCLGYMFVFYSSEVKQYMSDVFTLLCVFYFVTREYKNEKNKYWLLGIIGTIAVFLSNVAPVILFTCGLYMGYDHIFVRKKKITPLLAVFSVWLSAFLLYYCFFIYEHPTKEFMVRFWQRSFLPINPFKADFYLFLIKIPVTVFTAIFALSIEKTRSIIVACGLLILFVTGIVQLIRDKKIKLIILTCVPVLLHLLISAFRLYPFDRRLILYTLPGMIIVCALGFDYFAKTVIPLLKHKNIRLFVMIIPILFSSFFLFSRYPIKLTENKESIKYIEKHINDSKNIYLCGTGSIAMKYYNDTGFLLNGTNIINEKIIAANEKALLNNTDFTAVFENCMNELNLLHHKNWILFSGVLTGEKFIISKLDSLGYDRVKEFHTKGSSVYLYDFGE